MRMRAYLGDAEAQDDTTLAVRVSVAVKSFLWSSDELYFLCLFSKQNASEMRGLLMRALIIWLSVWPNRPTII
jgi:hypothetical protein